VPEDLKIKVTGDTADFEARIKAIEEKLKSVDPAADQVGKSLEDMGEKGKAGAEKAEGAFSKLGGAVESFVGNLGAMAAQKALSLLSDGIGLIKRGFEETIRAGVEFDKSMQDSKGGIAAVTMAALDFKDATGKVLTGQDAVNASFKLATEIQEKLVEAAKKTPATYVDLVAAFQNGFLPAMQAGVKDTDRFIKILVDASNAAGVLGVQSQGLSQEITALFRGEAGPDNKLVNALKVTKEEMENVVKSGGSMADFLDKKLKPFADAAAVSAGNFSVVISGMKDTFAQTAGELAKPIFMELIKGAGEAEKYLEGLKGKLGETGVALGEVVHQAVPVVKALADIGLEGMRAGAQLASGILVITEGLAQLKSDVTEGPLGKLGSAMLDVGTSAKIAAGPLGAVVGWIKELGEGKTNQSAEFAKAFAVSLSEMTHQTVSAATAQRLLGVEMKDRQALVDEATRTGKDLNKVIDEHGKTTTSTKDALKAANIEATEQAKRLADQAKETVKLTESEQSRIRSLSERASKEEGAAKELATLLAELSEKYKRNATDIAAAATERNKNHKATETEIEDLAKLADANDMGRGSIKEYEAGLAALAKARGVSVQEIRNEVEAKKQEIQANKDSIPVYKNVAEAMAGATRATDAQAAAIRGEIDAINNRALAESRRIGEGKGKTPDQYAAELANIDAETAAIQERNRAGDGGSPSEYMDTLIVQRKKETEAYMLLQIAQAKANEDLAKSKDKVTEANDRAAKSEGNFSEALSKAGVLIVSYSETLRGLHGQIVELNEEQNKLIDGLARVAGQYSLTDVESRRLLTTMEKKLELLGKENDWFTNQARVKAVEEYTNGLQDLIDAWSMARVDMPNSAIAIADLNTQMAEAVRIADQLRKTFGG